MSNYQTGIEREVEQELVHSAITEIKRTEKKLFGEHRDTNKPTAKAARKAAKKKKH